MCANSWELWLAYSTQMHPRWSKVEPVTRKTSVELEKDALQLLLPHPLPISKDQHRVWSPETHPKTPELVIKLWSYGKAVVTWRSRNTACSWNQGRSSNDLKIGGFGLDYLKDPIVITKALKSGRGRQKRGTRGRWGPWRKARERPCCPWGCPMRQGMWEAWSSWKSQEKGSPPLELRKECCPAHTILSPVRLVPYFYLQTWK